MEELISLIILIFSFLGIVAILLRKIPLLLELPDNLEAEISLVDGFKKKREETNKKEKFLGNLSFEVILQKILSKINILNLKIENKISFWLQKLREKSKEEKLKEDDNYWDELREATKKDNNFPR